MKNWAEIEGQIYLYLTDVCNTTDDDDSEVIIPKFQKLKLEYLESDELMFTVSGGSLDGFELYFYTKRDKPEDLLTEKEYLVMQEGFKENESEEVNALRWVVEEFERVLSGEKAGSVQEALSFAKSVLKKYQ